jgi:hypothetical protein
MKGKFVSYLRVSTQRQGRSGLGLEAQREAVNSYLNGGSWTLLAETVEVESGKRNDRPQLAAALRLCRLHKATLLVAKLDRAFCPRRAHGAISSSAKPALPNGLCCFNNVDSSNRCREQQEFVVYREERSNQSRARLQQ